LILIIYNQEKGNMLNKILVIILFLLTPLFNLNMAYSEVYKWIDEDGKVVYGDKPVSSNAVRIKIKNAPKQDNHYQEQYKKTTEAA